MDTVPKRTGLSGYATIWQDMKRQSDSEEGGEDCSFVGEMGCSSGGVCGRIGDFVEWE